MAHSPFVPYSKDNSKIIQNFLLLFHVQNPQKSKLIFGGFVRFQITAVSARRLFAAALKLELDVVPVLRLAVVPGLVQLQGIAVAFGVHNGEPPAALAQAVHIDLPQLAVLGSEAHVGKVGIRPVDVDIPSLPPFYPVIASNPGLIVSDPSEIV